MNDGELEGLLQSIGKACFVNYFPQFSKSALSDEAVTRILVRREGWAETSTRHRRVRGARQIIKAGRACDTLMLIASSERVSKEVQSRALSLAQHVC